MHVRKRSNFGFMSPLNIFDLNTTISNENNKNKKFHTREVPPVPFLLTVQPLTSRAFQPRNHNFINNQSLNK